MELVYFWSLLLEIVVQKINSRTKNQGKWRNIFRSNIEAKPEVTFYSLRRKRVHLIDFLVSKQIYLYMLYHIQHFYWSAKPSIICTSRSLLPWYLNTTSLCPQLIPLHIIVLLNQIIFTMQPTPKHNNIQFPTSHTHYTQSNHPNLQHTMYIGPYIVRMYIMRSGQLQSVMVQFFSIPCILGKPPINI